MSADIEQFHCGYVAIVGRPNMGKSTLLNHVLGQKLSITSRKPQTTRHNILGIKTEANHQIIFVDTPGIHKANKRAMNRYMNRVAIRSLVDVDVVLFVVEALHWTDEDQIVFDHLKESSIPVIAVVNKVDRVKDKERLFPFLQQLAAMDRFTSILPISATKGDNLSELEEQICRLLPEGVPFFPEDQITDRSVRFLAAELIREKLMRRLGEELPYALTVEIEQFKEEAKLLRISAVIWVERDNQKSIVIGKKGSQLKEIGKQAREDMERMFDNKVFLQLWVKVKSGWSDDERALQSLGYRDES